MLQIYRWHCGLVDTGLVFDPECPGLTLSLGIELLSFPQV